VKGDNVDGKIKIVDFVRLCMYAVCDIGGKG
jgi:hypothetical protein